MLISSSATAEIELPPPVAKNHHPNFIAECSALLLCSVEIWRKGPATSSSVLPFWPFACTIWNMLLCNACCKPLQCYMCFCDVAKLTCNWDDRLQICLIVILVTMAFSFLSFLRGQGCFLPAQDQYIAKIGTCDHEDVSDAACCTSGGPLQVCLSCDLWEFGGWVWMWTWKLFFLANNKKVCLDVAQTETTTARPSKACVHRVDMLPSLPRRRSFSHLAGWNKEGLHKLHECTRGRVKAAEAAVRQVAANQTASLKILLLAKEAVAYCSTPCWDAQEDISHDVQQECPGEVIQVAPGWKFACLTAGPDPCFWSSCCQDFRPFLGLRCGSLTLIEAHLRCPPAFEMPLIDQNALLCQGAILRKAGHMEGNFRLYQQGLQSEVSARGHDNRQFPRWGQERVQQVSCAQGAKSLLHRCNNRFRMVGEFWSWTKIPLYRAGLQINSSTNLCL